MIQIMDTKKIMMKKLFDNRFWYIGFTHAAFNDVDYENNPCVIIRNPFGKRKSLHERNHNEWIKDADYRKEYEQAYAEIKDNK